MVVTGSISTREIGRAFAQVARDAHVVEELWVSTGRDGVHLWLLTAPIDLDAEEHLHELTDPLYEQFPEADFQLHVLNPRHYRGDVRLALPSGVEQISLRAG